MVQFYSWFFYKPSMVPRHIHIGDHLLNLLLLWFETQSAHCDLRWRLSQPSDAQVPGAMVRWWWGCRWCWWCWGFAICNRRINKCPFSRCDIRYILLGGIPTPLKNMKVKCEYYSQYMENKTCSKPPTSIRYIRYQAISRLDVISHLRRSTEEKTRMSLLLLGPTKGLRRKSVLSFDPVGMLISWGAVSKNTMGYLCLSH